MAQMILSASQGTLVPSRLMTQRAVDGIATSADWRGFILAKKDAVACVMEVAPQYSPKFARALTVRWQNNGQKYILLRMNCSRWRFH